MQNSKSLSELLERGGTRLSLLKARSEARVAILEQVKAALPPKLADAVSSAGLELGKLTVGVSQAVWASRLRYSAEALKKKVSKSSGQDIQAVRIRVLPPEKL
jgi:hypothetical protein